MSKETMKLALEALEWNMDYLPSHGHGTSMASKAITALRKALAEQPAPMIRGDIRDGLVDDEPAQQEPVAWMRHDGTRCCPDEYRKDYPDYETRYPTPLYAHPAAQGSPVAWMLYAKDGLSVYVTDNPTGISEGQRALPLYTSPPASKPWAGLTADEVWQSNEVMALNAEMGLPMNQIMALIAWADAKLREKNT